jgi:hypothetical protein
MILFSNYITATTTKSITTIKSKSTMEIQPPVSDMTMTSLRMELDEIEPEPEHPEHPEQPAEDEQDESPEWGDITDIDISVKMLRRRKDIREALVLGLREAFPERFGAAPEDDATPAADPDELPDIPDETIVEFINMDPDVKTTMLEILLELTDCTEAEGETTYYPSIQDYDCVEDILEIERATGFRESREALPFKYEHLTTETISLIYSNPQILPLISKMKKEQITDAFVRSALGATKK